MKVILLIRNFLPILALIGLLAACGGEKQKPKADTSKKIQLAEFIKGKRVWVLEPEPEHGEEEPDTNPAGDPENLTPKVQKKSIPPSKKDECDPPQEIDESPKSVHPKDHGAHQQEEIFLQFNADGTVQVGGRNEQGEAVAEPSRKRFTYEVKNLKVELSSRDQMVGHILFGSNEPKPGDVITLVEGERKAKTKITKIEPATKLKEELEEEDPVSKSNSEDLEAKEEDRPDGKK